MPRIKKLVVSKIIINHIYLIVAIEKEFNIKFTTELIMTWEDVGAMVKYIAKNV